MHSTSCHSYNQILIYLALIKKNETFYCSQDLEETIVFTSFTQSSHNWKQLVFFKTLTMLYFINCYYKTSLCKNFKFWSTPFWNIFLTTMEYCIQLKIFSWMFWNRWSFVMTLCMYNLTFNKVMSYHSIYVPKQLRKQTTVHTYIFMFWLFLLYSSFFYFLVNWLVRQAVL